MPNLTIDARELERLRSCENAWRVIYNQLLAFNPEFCQGVGTGWELALIEIMRLQLCAHQQRKQTSKQD